MMKFTKSLRQALINEVKSVPNGYGAGFEADGPPEVEIKTTVAGPWIWINSEADYEGRTMDRTSGVSGDPYSAHVFHNWVGEVKSAPKSVKHLADLHNWALLHTEYVRQYTDTGSWGVHSGRWVDGITKEGIVSLRVESKSSFQDVSPRTETTSIEVDLNLFKDRSLDALVGLLKIENAFVRELAIKLLKPLDDLRAIEPIIQVTDDESKYVREIAIGALGQLGGSEAIQKLTTMLTESVYPSSSVSSALVEIGEPALDSLVPAIQSENDRVSNAALRIIESIGGNKAIKILNQGINDQQPSVRQYSIRALGNIGAIEAIDNIIRCLKDEDTGIQQNAVQALGMLKDKHAVEPLFGMLLASDKYVRSDVTEALDILGWKPSSPEENASYLYAKQDWDKLVAMGETAVEPMLRAMDDDDAYLRGQLLVSISKAHVSFTDPRIVESILKIYADKELSDSHKEAIQALGGLMDEQVVEPLLRIYMHEEGNNLQKAAFKSIKRLVRSDVEVADTLIPMMKEKPPSRFKDNEIQAYVKLLTVIPASLVQIKKITSLLKSAVKRDIDKETTEIASGMLELVKLYTDLTDGNKVTREKTVESLSKIQCPSAAIPLIKALEDDYSMVRKKAAIALGKLGEFALWSLLAALHSKSPQVRFGAARALGHMQIQDISAAKPLMKALRDKHRIVRQNAAWALGHLRLATGHHKDLVMKVIKALTKAMDTDEYLPVRFNAVYSMGNMGDSRVVEPLFRAIVSPTEEFRLNATGSFSELFFTLKNLSDIRKQVIDRLIIALSDDVDRVRYNAIEGLRLYAGEKALKALVSIQDDKDAKIRELVESGIENIERLKGRERSSWASRKQRRYEINEPDMMEELIQLLQDDDESVQISAQIGLGEIGQFAFDRLMEVLQDKNMYWLIREGAAGALGRIRDKRAVEALIEALQDEKQEIRCNAAWSLAELKDERSIRPLVEATKDEFWRVRLNAVAGLGKIKGRAALEAVLRLTEDEHPRVREVSTSYLAQFKSSRVIPALKERLKDEDATVRKIAKDWLAEIEKRKSKSKKKK